MTARSDRIKILQFISSFDIGGTERQVVDLARRLDASRFEARFACMRRGGSFLEQVEASGIPIAEYGINSLHNWSTFKKQVKFARDLRRDGIQIAHTYNFYPNVFAILPARLAGVSRVVASIRDTGVYQSPMQQRVQRQLCGLADCVVVNAEAVRRWLVADGFRPERIVVIPNGVDLARFPPAAPRPGLRGELNLPPEAPVLAVLSRLTRLKGFEQFLEAAALVSARFPAARFMIVGDRSILRDGAVVGDAQYRAELQSLADRLGIGDRLVFTGYRMDVPAVLAEVSVSVLPSLSEGLSNAVLESMAAGVPVVATRVGGTPEAVEDGVTGLLVPPRDPGALARAMCALLENRDLAERIGRAGRERIAARFSLERMVAETERLYERLARGAEDFAAGWPSAPARCRFTER